MASLDIQKKTIDAMTVMNVAITNIRLYPPTSAIIRNTVGRAHQIFGEIFKKEDAVILAESGANFIICGQIFNENDQKKYPQATSFLDLLIRFGIRSIAFQKRLAKQELKTFLKIISKGAREVEAAGGLPAVVAQEKLPNIIMDHKVYVVVDKDQQIVASIDITDEDIVQYVTGEHPLSETDVQKLKELARDPKWVTQVFQAGMAYIMKQQKDKPYEKLSEIVGHMIRTLDEISDNINRQKISGELAHTIADMDENTLTLILFQDTEGMFSEELFDQVIAELDDQKFERLTDRIRNIAGNGLRPDGRESASHTYRLLMRSDKGQRLKERVQRRMALNRTRREQEIARMKAALSGILRGDAAPLADREIMSHLPQYLFQLFNSGQEKSAEALMTRLSEYLISGSPKARELIAEALSQIGQILLDEHHLPPLVKVMPRWIAWIRAETDPPPAYGTLCIRLQDLARELIRSYRFTASHPVLDIFNQIHYGKISKEAPIQALSGDVLRDIATADVMDLLLEEFQTNEANKRKQAIDTLSRLGEISMERLLELLQNSRDMSQRVRILQAVSEIGQPVPQTLIEKIEAGGPWYYMRNLILVLGKIGTEDHLPILIPLLRHEDFRVQRETLNTIYNIGGKYRGEVLLSALPTAEDRLKLSLVDMLGALKYEKAVPRLLQMLESKSFFSSKDTDKLYEKICIALGRIGSERAVPVLKSIAGQKRLLSLGSYSEGAKTAADRALKQIRNVRSPEQMAEKEGVRIPVNYKLALPEAPDQETSPPSAIRLKLPEPGSPAGSESPRLKLPDAPSAEKIRRDADTVEESAVTMLLESIAQYARAKDFEKAEAMRQKLGELDSMALSELLRAEEIIEQAKNEPGEIEQDHLGIWPDLYDMLTPEEANALYYATEEAVYDADQTIFSQGDPGSRLYFIHKGQLKLFFTQGERESLLKTIGKGDVVGEDTFFSISVYTTSLTTLTYTELSYLDKSVLKRWKDDFPALESKLHDYCLRLERVHDILKDKGMDRRTQTRAPIRGTVSVRLLSQGGGVTGKGFRGSFLDISVGGLSFIVKMPNQRNATLLLGRRLGMEFDFPAPLVRQLGMGQALPENTAPIRVRQLGTVIGVTHRDEDDYSVHIKFDALLGDMLTKKFARQDVSE